MAETTLVVVPMRVKGLWRIVLLGWAISLFRLGPQQVKVEFVDPDA